MTKKKRQRQRRKKKKKWLSPSFSVSTPFDVTRLASPCRRYRPTIVLLLHNWRTHAPIGHSAAVRMRLQANQTSMPEKTQYSSGVASSFGSGCSQCNDLFSLSFCVCSCRCRCRCRCCCASWLCSIWSSSSSCSCGILSELSERLHTCLLVVVASLPYAIIFVIIVTCMICVVHLVWDDLFPSEQTTATTTTERSRSSIQFDLICACKISSRSTDGDKWIYIDLVRKRSDLSNI